MSRVYNFSAGPSTLAEPVLRIVQEELMDWQGTGMSVMEMSHRSKEFITIAEQAEQDLRQLLSISSEYRVLFIQGGARAQFSLIPLNLLQQDSQASADYCDSGYWAAKAIDEAKRYCQVNIVASVTDSDGQRTLAPMSEWSLNEHAKYLHITPNETIDGIQIDSISKEGLTVPIVADMSSTILSEPVTIDNYGLIYAGAQKNIGPAGLTVIIVHDDLLKKENPLLPSVFSYRKQADANSMYNTPPTFAWYIAGLTFRWLLERGGLAEQQKININKAAKLYKAIDGDDFYHNNIAATCRSKMNIPFTLADNKLDSQFLAEAVENGLCNLKGHRAVGGVRASIYNALPEQAIDCLVEFMAEFSRKNG